MLNKPGKSKSKQAFTVQIPMQYDPFMKRHKSQDSYSDAKKSVSKHKKTKYIKPIVPQDASFSKTQKGFNIPSKMSPLNLDNTNHQQAKINKLKSSNHNDKQQRNLPQVIEDNQALLDSLSNDNDVYDINTDTNNQQDTKSGVLSDFYTNSIQESAFCCNENERDEGIINSLPLPFVKQFELQEKLNNDCVVKEKIQTYYRKLFVYSKKGDRNAFLKYLSLLSSVLKKININYKDDSGWSFIHYASYEGNLKIVEILIELNANVNAKTVNLKTPILLSCEKGYFDITRILIENGGILSSLDNEKNTAVHLCCLNGHVELLKYLLEKNPDADCKNIYNKTPLCVGKNEKIREILKDYLSKTTFHYHKVTIFETKNKVASNMLIGAYRQPKKTINAKQQQPSPKNVTKRIPQLNVNNTNSQQPIINNIIEIIKLDGGQNNSFNNSIINNQYTTTPHIYNEINVVNTSPIVQNNQLISNHHQVKDESVGPEDFICFALIGKGSFGEVFLVQKKDTKEFYAMKVLSKNIIMGQNLVKYAMTERNVLSLTNHPFIVKLSYSFQTKEQLFLILDYCTGGNLADHLSKETKFDESRAKIYLCELILAIEDLHKRNIIFRDLKPDNIVLDKDGHALLTDFGLSKEGVEGNKCAQSFCGSMAYLAPEMVKKTGHGKSIDWYLLGVVFYEMILGVPPYFTTNKEQLFNNIQYGELNYPDTISQEGISLLKGLLTKNPLKRLGSGKGDYQEIKAHAYFKGINWKDVYNRKLKPPIPPKANVLEEYIFPKQFSEYFCQNEISDNRLINHFVGWSFINNSNS